MDSPPLILTNSGPHRFHVIFYSWNIPLIFMPLGVCSWCSLSLNLLFKWNHIQLSRLRSNPIFLRGIFLNFSLCSWNYNSYSSGLQSTCWLKFSVSAVTVVWVHIFTPLGNEKFQTGIRNLCDPSNHRYPSIWNGILHRGGSQKCLLDQTSRSSRDSFLKGDSVAKGISFYANKISPPKEW